MTASELNDADRHRRQEAEANAFSIELLTPRNRLRPYLRSSADLKQVLQMARDFDISREAAARRYVELHPETLAVVFCKAGKFIYGKRCNDFPALSLRSGETVPIEADGTVETVLPVEEVDASDWIFASQGRILTAQTYFQQERYSTTLLRIEEDEVDEEVDDTFERFIRGRE